MAAFAAWPVVVGIGFLLGCGGAGTPQVDPHPLSEGGIPDRTVFEAGFGDTSGDGSADNATDATETGDVGLGDASAGDAAGDTAGEGGLDGSPGDAGRVPTTLVVTVTDPTDGALRVAAARFAPAITVLLTTDPLQPDDVKDVVGEVWTTGAMPMKMSTTKLALLSRNGPGADAGAIGSDASGTSDSGAAGSDGGTGSPGIVVTFSFGDTPIDLSSLATGAYELRISATTLTGSVGTATRAFRVDAGPIIQVISPTPDQAARGSIFVSVRVTDPFSSTPPTVSISVANIPISPLTINGDLYQATVPETIAMPPLSGQQLLDVGATNAAGVAAHHVVVRFLFDDVGPVISNGKPATGSLIGGIVKIEADVTDPSGVAANSVVAVVAHGGTSLEVALDQDPNDAKHYSHLFDTRRLSNTVLYPTLSFRASDIPGNQSNIGYTVAVDNTPPLSDLDPPADLRVRHNVNQSWQCSWRFDPLGTDAVNDGDLVAQLFDVRARVQDQGNSPAAGGADIIPLSGLDPAHVELLVLDDTTQALVVDTDGDGACDAVNPKLVPTTTPMSSRDALLVNLAPIPATGTGDFTPDPSIAIAGFADCVSGNDPLRPPALCRTSDMTIAIPTTLSIVPAVWSIPNVVPGTLQCVGNQLDSLGNHLLDGPACLAVRALDQLGNSQVSRVLHVCIDHDASGGECPFAAITTVAGGTPVRVTTAAPHGLVTGNRALVGSVPTLFDANGLWTVTVVDGTTFTLDSSSTPAVQVFGGQFMRWTSVSDCTGRQTSLSPVVVDDTTACLPWRRYSRGEHLDIN